MPEGERRVPRDTTQRRVWPPEGWADGFKSTLLKEIIPMIEVYSRWSSVDLRDQTVDGGEMNTFSLGVNWSPVSSIQFNVNYRYSTLDRFGAVGFNHGIVARLVFILE
jgi:hypothetical protein